MQLRHWLSLETEESAVPSNQNHGERNREVLDAHDHERARPAPIRGRNSFLWRSPYMTRGPPVRWELLLAIEPSQNQPRACVHTRWLPVKNLDGHATICGAAGTGESLEYLTEEDAWKYRCVLGSTTKTHGKNTHVVVCPCVVGEDPTWPWARRSAPEVLDAPDTAPGVFFFGIKAQV